MDIIIKNLNKYYGEKHIIKNLNLEIKKNKATCIMAPSGFGKTTLLNILIGIDKDFTGEILGLKDKKISVTFQEDRLFENLSIYSNINFVLNNKIDKNILKKELLKFDLENIVDDKVKNLSGGMKRRISILRSLLFDFDILFLDEPFKGIDFKAKESVIKYILEKSSGKTVILITHDKREAEMLNSNIISI